MLSKGKRIGRPVRLTAAEFTHYMSCGGVNENELVVKNGECYAFVKMDPPKRSAHGTISWGMVKTTDTPQEVAEAMSQRHAAA